MGKFLLLLILFSIFVGPVIFNKDKKKKNISYLEVFGGLFTSIAGIGCMIPIIAIGWFVLWFIWRVFFGG